MLVFVTYIHIGGGNSSYHGLFGELLRTQPDEQGEHNNITSCVYNLSHSLSHGVCGLAKFIK